MIILTYNKIPQIILNPSLHVEKECIWAGFLWAPRWETSELFLFLTLALFYISLNYLFESILNLNFLPLGDLLFNILQSGSLFILYYYRNCLIIWLLLITAFFWLLLNFWFGSKVFRGRKMSASSNPCLLLLRCFIQFRWRIEYPVFSIVRNILRILTQVLSSTY